MRACSSWNVGRRQYRRQYGGQSYTQQTIQRRISAGGKPVTMTPKILPVGASIPAADDVNHYGGGCVVHRALPSLPRRMEGSWAKSVRSDASGSDASLHWDTGDDDVTAAGVDDLPQPARQLRCRSVAAGPGDYASAGRGDGGGAPVAHQPVRDVPGYRTMPRPSAAAQYGVLVAEDVDQQQLLHAQQLRRQSRPSDSADVRPYANVSTAYSVDVWRWHQRPLLIGNNW